MEVPVDRPCVGVLTPVYNGEEYLAECIESVLAQDYATFEYDIVDNCSTDSTREIAWSYAKQDARIRVRTNTMFVNCEENHNRAFALLPSYCKYCKIVSADDWIAPNCLSTMVEFAEENPTVGIVGSYQRSDGKIKWRGLPPTTTVLSGRAAARLLLLEGILLFAAPTSLLYRADLIRVRTPFFPHTRSHADASACYEAFQYCDAGFVHEILSNERVYPGQVSAEMEALGAGWVTGLEFLLQYGPVYLSTPEFANRKKEAFEQYYRILGRHIWKSTLGRGRGFWNFQRSRLADLGCQLEWDRVARASIKEALIEAKNPTAAVRKVFAAKRARPNPAWPVNPSS